MHRPMNRDSLNLPAADACAGPSAAVAESHGVSASCLSPAAACVPRESTRQARSVMVSGIDVNQVEGLVI